MLRRTTAMSCTASRCCQKRSMSSCMRRRLCQGAMLLGSQTRDRLQKSLRHGMTWREDTECFNSLKACILGMTQFSENDEHEPVLTLVECFSGDRQGLRAWVTGYDALSASNVGVQFTIEKVSRCTTLSDKEDHNLELKGPSRLGNGIRSAPQGCEAWCIRILPVTDHPPAPHLIHPVQIGGRAAQFARLN